MSRALRRPLSFQSQAIADKAGQVAAAYRHSYVDHAHFMLAFLDVPNCAVQAISKERGATLPRLRQTTIAFLDTLPSLKASNRGANSLQASHRMEAILELAQHEAILRKARHVSPRHLLLALATEDLMSEAERGSPGARLLAPMELAPNQMRRILFPTPQIPGPRLRL